MARSFTETEKENIRKRLLDACRQSWTQYGYKKTSVDELCQQAGISKGAFYLFFESKEALFCDVLCSVQNQICDAASAILAQHRNKYGMTEALKLIYREYDKNQFLYNADSADFTVFQNKLSKEQAEKIKASQHRGIQLFLSHPYLKLKTNQDMALSVIYSLLMNMKNKELLPCSHTEAFDFMAACLIDHLYEEENHENRTCKKE